MKKLPNAKLIFASILVLMIISFGNLVFGQEVSSDDLIGKLNRIADLLENLAEKNDPQSEGQGLGMTSSNTASGGTSLLADECFNKIYYGQGTPNAWSSNYQENPWDLNAVVPMVNNINNTVREMEQFTDMNGDGLADYFYIRSAGTYTYQDSTACVFLNTGTGFNLVHYCAVTADASGEKYYGSCADYSS